MTETEWLAATDPLPMLKYFGDKVSDRKQRLFCDFCCRIVWNHLDDCIRASLEIAGEYPDFPTCRPQLEAAFHRTESVIRDKLATGDLSFIYSGIAVRNLCHPEGGAGCLGTACLTASDLSNVTTCDLRESVEQQTSFRQSRVIRCIFGNPFRAIVIDPRWLTSDVQMFAAGIYQERAFDRMPILADALQDAGCDNDDILNHCRQSGEHARGCWVVDLILGKS